MTAYYNENDPKAAAWLRELIAHGLIAPGDVDERSIEDVCPRDVMGYTQCHWFAGIGGWSLALRLAGWPDDRSVWTGSCPCQPFSTAGSGKGIDDPRHLWPALRWHIDQCRPATVFGEQVIAPVWIDGVLADFEQMGYTVRETDLCASIVGLPRRKRLFWVANSNGNRKRICPEHEKTSGLFTFATADFGEWALQTGLVQSRDGLPARVGRLRGYGNAIVPQVAAKFIEAFTSEDLYGLQN